MMIGVPCNGCIFFDKTQKACSVNEFCIRQGDLVIAPGLCKIRRDQKWKDKKIAEGKTQILHEAICETHLDYDLVVVYDHKKHTMLDLVVTLNALRGYGQVIIVDTTGPEGREHDARKAIAFLRENVQTLGDFKYDVMMDREFARNMHIEHAAALQAAIHYASRLVSKPYFIAIEAGKRISGFFEFVDWFDDNSTRAIFYHFPHRFGDTLISRPGEGFGVYVTTAYRGVGKESGKTFLDKLAEIERESGFSLAWFSEHGEVV